MKTSNKLLITLAIVLFAIPLSAIIYESRNYVDKDTYKEEKATVKLFKDPLKGYAAIPLQSFNSIAIADGQGYYLSLSVVQDTQFGVKIPDYAKDYMRFTVNANGVLEVTVLKKPEQNTYISLVLYAPVIKALQAANMEGISIPGTYDTLEVSLQNVERFNLSDANTVNALKIDADKVSSIYIGSANIHSLQVSLKDSKFESNNMTYKNLSIHSAGAATIELANKDAEKPQVVENFTLNTIGKNDVNMENVQFNAVSGSLSDATTIHMPVVYLRHLLK